jgi:hypothetical protein
MIGMKVRLLSYSLVVAGCVVLFCAQRQTKKALHRQNEQLRLQVEALHEGADRSREQLRQTQAQIDEQRRLREEHANLIRLRSEAERLRNAARAAAVAEAESQKADNQWTADSLKDVGFATPDATLQTFLTALRDANGPRASECLGTLDPGLTPEAVGGFTTGPSWEMFRRACWAGQATPNNFQIVAFELLNDDSATFRVRTDFSSGDCLTNAYCLKRDGDNWKILLDAQHENQTFRVNGFLRPEALRKRD